MKAKKIIFVIARKIVSIINYFNSDLYTRLYSKMLYKMGMKIDKYPKYIDPSVWFDGKDYSIIKIGKNSVLSKEVILLTHDYSISRALQSIGKLNPEKDKEKYLLNEIIIGQNCFIGARAVVLPGTKIGNNVIIGAGCVVKGTVEENSIVVGNPARIIGKIKDFAKKKQKETLE